MDNIKVIQTIQSNLNIGRITEEKNMNRCSFIIEDISSIIIISSIFKNYPLHTSKRLDFNNFYCEAKLYLLKLKIKIYLILI